MIEEAKYKQKTLPNIDEDHISISSYFTDNERYRIQKVFQDYHHMDINTLAEHDKVLDTLFKKLGIIQEPYIINTIFGKALVLASDDLHYKIRMLDWTEEDIKQMGGLGEAWTIIGKDLIIKE